MVHFGQEGDYQLDSRHLTLSSLPAEESFVLEIDTEIYPHKNTSLEVNLLCFLVKLSMM